MSDIVGVDTNWLVAIAVEGHPMHSVAKQSWTDAVAAGERIGVVPQILPEFAHVVSDPRRFEHPCTVESALSFAVDWWDASEVAQLFPTAASVRLGWQWMQQHRLGRKRVLDTQFAATLFVHGVDRILTINPRDYAIFNIFDDLDGHQNQQTKA